MYGKGGQSAPPPLTSISAISSPTGPSLEIKLACLRVKLHQTTLQHHCPPAKDLPLTLVCFSQYNKRMLELAKPMSGQRTEAAPVYLAMNLRQSYSCPPILLHRLHSHPSSMPALFVLLVFIRRFRPNSGI